MRLWEEKLLQDRFFLVFVRETPNTAALAAVTEAALCRLPGRKVLKPDNETAGAWGGWGV